MPDNERSTIATADEIEAALAEAEAQATQIPNLDPGHSQSIIPVPVEPGPRPALPKQRAPDVSPVDATPPSGPADTKQPVQAPRTSGRLATLIRQWLSWLTRGFRQPGPTPPRVQREVGDQPAAEGGGLGRALYRLVDTLLWAINRPFEWMSPQTRQWTGLVAIVTIFTSLLALWLFPLLCPRRDALSQLTRQSAQVQAEGRAPAAPQD
jgi:hypothetical protein